MSFASFLGDFFDPLGLFHETSSKKQENERYDDQLQLQRDAFNYQKEYDQWAQGLAERNFQLQSSPVSSLVKDASTVGVNPMAAMGQSVGSASAGSSSVSGPSPVAPPQNINGSLISAIASTLNNRSSLDSQEKLADKSFALRQQELDLMGQLRNRELDIQQQDADTRAGELGVHQTDVNKRYIHLNKLYELDRDRFDLEVQKRLDQVLQNARQDSQFWAAHRAELQKIQHAREQLKYDEVRDNRDRRERYTRDIVLGISALGSIAGDIFKFMQFGGALPF